MGESIQPQAFKLHYPEVLDFSRCNNSDIDWYMMMQTDLPPVGPKVEMLLELWKEEDAFLEQTFPAIG